MIIFKKNIFDFDTVFLSYDEPFAESRYHEIKLSIPDLIHVENIKGFDRAHKKCAEITKSDYVTIIDGDNTLIQDPDKAYVPKRLLNNKYTLSFSSVNSINGLIYGNGGIKCWPKETLLKMKSHEEAKTSKAITDFCFIVPYFQIPATLSQTNIHLTPYQAFRSGYREGVKMCLNEGVPFNNAYDIFKKSQAHNLYRLKVWCEVGRDVDNGIWAIYGARLGAYSVLNNPSHYQKIQDYDYLDRHWNESLCHEDPDIEAKEILLKLNKSFSLRLGELNAKQSTLFKSIMKNPRREGPMTL